uniref:Uncharacterized protein n=1 Tax=Fagus sylvatica TaxID=28930 RepID=A0A2N9FST4_FAGSY
MCGWNHDEASLFSVFLLSRVSVKAENSLEFLLSQGRELSRVSALTETLSLQFLQYVWLEP